MHYALNTHQALRKPLIEIVGEIVEFKGTKMRRVGAKEVAKLDQILFYHHDSNYLMIKIDDLAYRLAHPSSYFEKELLNEPAVYSADGILFPILVQLVRGVEEDLFGRRWLPDQVRALGLAVNPGEQLAGASGLDSYSIRNAKGDYREFYRIT
jgi:hypothetical protein